MEQTSAGSTTCCASSTLGSRGCACTLGSTGCAECVRKLGSTGCTSTIGNSIIGDMAASWSSASSYVLHSIKKLE